MVENILPPLFCKWASCSARNEELLWFLGPNCYTTFSGANSILHQCQTWDGQRSTSTRHWVCDPFFFPKNPQLWITSSWDQRKPCTILANTAHLPPTVRRSRPVQSEAMPLWYIRFSPYTQVTHLVFYLLKPPNLAVEGDCTIAKITGEN